MDAAGVGAGLWVSYLFVLFYLLIAAGAVTHKDLFFETPVKLPFLGVDLPLKGFFWLGPALFLIVHAYVFLHFAMLAKKVGVFDQALRAQIEDGDVRTKLRRQLPSNIFVQLLAGPGEDRDGVMGLLLWLIALISLVIGPICLLIFFELQFLPYHHPVIAWWQRIAVGIDLVLMWTFWRRIALRGGAAPDHAGWRGRLIARWQRAFVYTIMITLTCGAAVLMLGVATYPGEGLETWTARQGEFPGRESLNWLRTKLVAGIVNPASRQPESLWANRLVLPGLDVVVHLKLDSETKIDFLPETASLRWRNLDGAVLIDAVLRKVDFTGASLRGARLENANLRQAKLGCGDWLREGTKEKDEERPPICVQLQGASLNFAQLQGAYLGSAQLQGASLNSAQLQGASLVGANFIGAELRYANLQGALLDHAQLQASILAHAQLQGALLTFAELQGAILSSADLQGASLDGAWLLGISLDGAQLQGASLRNINVWRSDLPPATITNALIELASTEPEYPCKDGASGGVCRWTADAFRRFKDEITREVPDSAKRVRILEVIETTLNPDKPYINEDHVSSTWNMSNLSKPTVFDHEAELARTWQEVGCAIGGSSFVVSQFTRRMIQSGDRFGIVINSQSPFTYDSPFPAKLAAAFLDPGCAGAKGISAETTAILTKLRGPTPSTP